MYRLLKLPYHNRARAEREVAGLVAHLPDPATRERLGLLLAASPAPEQGLHYFTLLRERQRAAFDRIVRTDAGLRHLVGVFTHSRFLAEELLEHAGWIDQLLDPRDLERAIGADDLHNRLVATLRPGVPQPVDLARFRRRQLLRIVVRDIFEIATLPEITGELTTLADVMIETAYQRIHQALVERHGTPRDAAGAESLFTVIALGKMGAEELNYSSDIDLMFLYSVNGATDGAQPISNKEFFKRAANQLTSLLSAYSGEGLCYRVDLRLRPDGSLGEVCIPLDAARQYYEKRARDWELQMLIKARVAAGHRGTGQALLDFAEPLIYKTSVDFNVIEQMSLTRERLNEKLASKAGARAKAGGLDVKLTRGGIRDIEFLVQCLQRLHGGAEPWLQHRATLLALARLHDKGVLSEADYGRLASAYQFLRHLEHRLQFDEDRQTHALPQEAAQLEILARRMPGGGGDAHWLRREIASHCENVTVIYDRVVHARAADPGAEEPMAVAGVRLTLEQRAPAVAAAFAKSDLRRGARAFEYFLERLTDQPQALAALEASPALTAAALDLIEHSPYFAEELIRRPESAIELDQPLEGLLEQEPPADAVGLRRWYRRAILRIEAESICRSQSVFETLAATSRLAEAVIAQSYQIALHEAGMTGTQRNCPMFVIGLGRLGMREFDLGSDADLTFVLHDQHAAEMPTWTRVAERIVQLIGAYTGEGVLFTVDTRLRPHGTAGPLVQTESAVIDYFARTAEAWESLTYLKSRTVAGDSRRAEFFLHRLQQVYGERYGLDGSPAADLREMRARLERDLSASRPMKAGRGGYYDIDFLLLYLRLKNAGVYYSALNTLERIEVLEAMEKLRKPDADFLRIAATFYRSLDHALRILTGHAEGRLPKAEAQIDALNAVLPRWTKVPLSDLPRIQEETRALYNRFFG